MLTEAELPAQNFLDFFTLESSCTNFISTQHTAGMSYEKPI